MAHILIDGYNLIGIAHGNLEKARNELVRKLYEYSKIKGHSITLVFDGWKAGQLTETRTKTGGLTVIYSKLGEKADNVIKRLTASAEQPLIVISSDREISDFAERKDFAAVTSEAFEKKLYSVLDNTEISSDYDEDEDIDTAPARQKGNANKLSKSKKKNLEALRKL